MGRESRIACEACWKAVIDLAICWSCGEIIVRESEVVSLGWCFWHKHTCFCCLLCGSKMDIASYCTEFETAESPGNAKHSSNHGNISTMSSPLTIAQRSIAAKSRSTSLPTALGHVGLKPKIRGLFGRRIKDLSIPTTVHEDHMMPIIQRKARPEAIELQSPPLCEHCKVKAAAFTDLSARGQSGSAGYALNDLHVRSDNPQQLNDNKYGASKGEAALIQRLANKDSKVFRSLKKRALAFGGTTPDSELTNAIPFPAHNRGDKNKQSTTASLPRSPDEMLPAIHSPAQHNEYIYLDIMSPMRGQSFRPSKSKPILSWHTTPPAFTSVGPKPRSRSDAVSVNESIADSSSIDTVIRLIHLDSPENDICSRAGSPARPATPSIVVNATADVATPRLLRPKASRLSDTSYYSALEMPMSPGSRSQSPMQFRDRADSMADDEILQRCVTPLQNIAEAVTNSTDHTTGPAQSNIGHEVVGLTDRSSPLSSRPISQISKQSFTHFSGVASSEFVDKYKPKHRTVDDTSKVKSSTISRSRSLWDTLNQESVATSAARETTDRVDADNRTSFERKGKNVMRQSSSRQDLKAELESIFAVQKSPGR